LYVFFFSYIYYKIYFFYPALLAPTW